MRQRYIVSLHFIHVDKGSEAASFCYCVGLCRSKPLI